MQYLIKNFYNIVKNEHFFCKMALYKYIKFKENYFEIFERKIGKFAFVYLLMEPRRQFETTTLENENFIKFRLNYYYFTNEFSSTLMKAVD